MSEDFIPTRGSFNKGDGQINFKSVTYESYKPKTHNKAETGVKTKDIPSHEFNIKKAKHEVIKYGMSGFDPQKKEEAKMQLAIKLGAKPPKNKYKNYKILKEERAKQKATEKLEVQFQQLGKNSEGKSIAKGKSFDRKRRKDKGGLLDIYGKVKINKQ